ncbi:phage tail protein [Kitasatospora sp. NPDC004615]|uniref:phage tail protein n=1 Tax=Kitasatospora sp. NPDC004615 TaxID=3364017 RepID=UPI003676D144
MATLAGELITRDLQIEWAGQLWGDGTLVQVAKVDGWDTLPAVDSGTVPRAQQHGSYLGRLLSQSRIITADMQVTAWPADFPAVRRALLAATALVQNEQPLVVRLAGETQLVRARVFSRAIPNDAQAAQGTPTVTVAWEATDPRRYDVAEQVLTTGLPQPGLGLDWADGASPPGLDWHDGDSPTGLDWGASTSTGNVACTNSGDAEAHPVLEIRGPVNRPSVTIVETGQMLEYDLMLAASDVLTVDTWGGTVTLASGMTRLYTATARSIPEGAFVLPPGTSTLAFRAVTADPAASLTVRFRSAYW